MFACYVRIFAVVCMYATACSSFNIDVSAPIFREGIPGTGFGFSIQGHSLSALEKGVIIGSPKSSPNGDIFWCSSEKVYCQRINVNVTDISRMPHDQTGALFGYSLSSIDSMKPSSVSVCAPRIIRSIAAMVYVSGGCFRLNENLNEVELHRATLSMCESIPSTDKIMDLRHCAMGTSVGQHKSAPDDLFLGGSYFYYAKGMGTVLNLKSYARWTTSIEGLLPNNLLGSAMDISDKVFSPKYGEKFAVYVAYGAPGVPTVSEQRTTLGNGSVWFFPKHPFGGQEFLTPVLKIDGRKFGSNFGHSLILLDINGDEWDDLIVGAPYQQTETREGGQPHYGAVSVFLNQQGRFPSPHDDATASPLFGYDREDYHQVLVPRETQGDVCGSAPLSGFGATVAKLGDINHDGYQDFAVGAPYGEKGGVVFVYHGTATGRIGPPTQVICAPSLSIGKTMNGFGMSIGLKGMDFDRNGYPDLAIGAPLSDNVVILRTRPIIRLAAHLVRTDGSTVLPAALDSLPDCTSTVRGVPGYKAPTVRCLDLKLFVTYASVDSTPCTDGKVYNIPVLLGFNPTEFWLTEKWKAVAEKVTGSGTRQPNYGLLNQCSLSELSQQAPNTVYREYDITPTSFFNEQTLNDLGSYVDVFFPFNKSAATNPFVLSTSNEVNRLGGYLQLNATAFCQKPTSGDPQWSSADLQNAPTVHLVLRDVNLIDQQNPLSIGVKWFADLPSPYPATQQIDDFAIADPRQNHQKILLPFDNECVKRPCCAHLKVDYALKVTRDKYGPVVYVGDDKEQTIELTVTVTNVGADPAYTVNLIGVYAEDLLELNEASNEARSLRQGAVLCPLANPLMPRSSSSCTIRWLVVGHHLTVQLSHFYINTTVTSGTNLPKEVQSQLVNQFRVNVKMVANVTVTGLIEPNMVYFTGNVSHGITSIQAENQIGDARLSVTFTVRNLRKHSLVPSSSLIIDWPYEFAGDVNETHGKYMLYLLEVPHVSQQRVPMSPGAAETSFTVTCDSRALETLVNPHRYRVFSWFRKKSDSLPVRMEPVDPPESHPKTYPPLSSQMMLEPVPERLADAKKQQKRMMTTISCYNGRLRCIPIVCDLGKLSYKAGPITLDFSARLWDNTMRDDFKRVFLTNLMLSATWRANVKYSIDLGDTDHAQNQVEFQIFNGLDPKPVAPKYMVLYISLAVFGGILLLAVLVLILYKAGFFKRKRFIRKWKKLGDNPQKPGEQKVTYQNPPEPPTRQTHYPRSSAFQSSQPAAPPHAGEVQFRGTSSEYQPILPASQQYRSGRQIQSFQ